MSEGTARTRAAAVSLLVTAALALSACGPGEDEPDAAPTQAATEVLYVSATGHYVRGAFRDFWDKRGGLAVFGYPLTEEFSEDGYIVQYFERGRFEYHDENKGTQYEVLLGLLGNASLVTDAVRYAREHGAPAEVTEALREHSRYPVPPGLLTDLVETMGRYGRLVLRAGEGGLELVSSDPAVLTEVVRSRKVAPHLGERLGPDRVAVPPESAWLYRRVVPSAMLRWKTTRFPSAPNTLPSTQFSCAPILCSSLMVT
jgi:hypothetical protein